MSRKKRQKVNRVQNNSKTPLNHSERMEKFRAIKLKQKQTLRIPNSGKFEHLKNKLASFKKTEAEYIKILNRKIADKMQRENNKTKNETVQKQANQPKPEIEIKNEDNLVIEEPKKTADVVIKEDSTETMNFEDIEVDDSELNDPALDDALAQLDEKIKKEEELKGKGIDPESVEEPEDPEIAEEFKSLMQETNQKLEGAELEEAFKSLGKEVEGEIKDSDANDHEINDPDVNEELNHIGQEIIKENEKDKSTEQSEPILDNQIENKENIEIQFDQITEIKEENQNGPTLEDDFPIIINNFNEPTQEVIKIVEDDKIKNKDNIEIHFDEITEIKEEEQKEHTLEDDFPIIINNFNEPTQEVIKIVEDETEKVIPESTEVKQVNTESANFNTHALFKAIENNVLNPKTENKVVVETKPKEEPKRVYSVPPIPGMNSTFKMENKNDAPKLTEEERQAKELADAKAMLERLKNIHSGTIEERTNRFRMINYYQDIVNKYKSSEELLEESIKLAEKAKREAQEREKRAQELKELEISAKKDIIEDTKNENKSFEIVNDDEGHSSLRIDDFYDKLRLRMDNQKVAEQVRDEMTAILKEAGITDQEKAFDIVASSYFEIKDTINSMYDSNVITETKMSTDAPLFFYNAFFSLKNAELSTKERIITAQKFADVMIKNYSPVAFVEKELDRFADSYVLNNLDILGVQLSNLGFNNLEVNKLINEISGVPENVQLDQDNAPDENAGPQPLHIPNFKQWLNEQIDNNNVHQQVRTELTDIIKSTGITNQELRSHLIDFSDRYLPKTIPGSPLIDGENPEMPQIAAQFFSESYNTLDWAELNPKDRIITAQKIADLMLKHYSPVAFKELQLEQYADNYVIKNREILGLLLNVKGIDKDKINPLIDEVQAELANATNNEQPTANQELTQEEKNRLLFGVDVDQYMRDKQNVNTEAKQENNPQQEQPQQNPVPKPNPTSVQNLGPEWISMPEFDQKLERLNKIAALPDNTKNRISDILKESGVEIGGADDPLEFKEIIKDAYDPKKLPRDVPQSMRDITKNVFISTYDAISKKGLTPRNKIETTQRITDVFLQLYSPASLSGVNELNKYTQNYVINDKNLLRECLITLKVPENDIKAIVGDVKTETKPEAKTEVKPEVKPEIKLNNADARVAVFTEKLKAYNNMYKLNIDSNNFASSVAEAWELMISGDKQKMLDGQKVMNNLFKDTLKKAFDIEKGYAYNEHRLPEYVEIIRSSNELLRSAMYGLTDMYHNPNRKDLFDITAFGGLSAKDMAALSVGNSLWSKDQNSDEAWEIQAKEAKAIADKWLKEDKPYEKMISEMKVLINANKEGIVSRKDIVDKLTAAEWLLINNEKMMIEDPEDPLNPIPNWGNRYWKALTETREALGIDKHTSMRDLIQGEYAAMAKSVNSSNYNKTQIQLYVLDPDVRELSDSMDVQKEQFATMSSAVTFIKPINEKQELNNDMTENRVPYSVVEEDERLNMKNQPKNYNFIVEPQKTNTLTIEGQGQKK